MAEPQNPLTHEIKALIGFTAEKVPVGPAWGIDREGIRIFTQAIMDQDPVFWDDDHAARTKFGEVVAPPIYCSYVGRKVSPGAPDALSEAFSENPTYDGSSGVRDEITQKPGSLPSIPTPLKRNLNAGNEMELYKYPALGDRIFSQANYANIVGRISSKGDPMLIVTTATTYTNQEGEVLCILRASNIIR
ncbi:MAG: hypothetical protein ABS76_07625 [Pelagibacterium sp. SCN 64-44]|nr:MAG: hypothetical protein ABS76_07625 [Pelagibacterium sp. SCN 64-44]